MWYTPVSGIWQTVWLECVPENYIEKIKLTPDLEGVDIEVKLIDGTMEDKEIPIKILLTLHNGQVIEKSFHGVSARIQLSDIRTEDGRLYVPKLWTPDEPYLYSMQIFAGEDSVETYFALRTINIEETPLGKRVCLNGTPIFLHGVLDQGYFCDGIFLPAKAEEYEKDIMRMKELGINMLRKHIKVEPEIFYYACDRLGMFVMQDMVNSGPYSFIFDTALPTIGLKKRPDTSRWKKTVP
jgi:beta-galactosidase/beta-glucuronidase